MNIDEVIALLKEGAIITYFKSDKNPQVGVCQKGVRSVMIDLETFLSLKTSNLLHSLRLVGSTEIYCYNPKEFTHIEIRVVRNPEWLKIREKQGFFLSEEFPIGEFKLPSGFEDMTENDVETLRDLMKGSSSLESIPDLETFLAETSKTDKKVASSP